jgi:hydrogenase nickel incorporation protein HypA/HybF
VHELSIALALLDQLEALAAERGIARFERIEVAAGLRRGIVPEALELAFREAARGGVAADAQLELTIVPAWARCRGCGHAFAPAIDDYRCARCGQADVEIQRGDDIVLNRVTGAVADADEEVPQ